jgi:hypothetical protein
MEFAIASRSFRNFSVFNNSLNLNLQIYLTLLICYLYHLILLLLYQDLHLVQMQSQINCILKKYHLQMFYYFILINFFTISAQFWT